jgi:hypothetical protein
MTKRKLKRREVKTTNKMPHHKKSMATAFQILCNNNKMHKMIQNIKLTFHMILRVHREALITQLFGWEV